MLTSVLNNTTLVYSFGEDMRKNMGIVNWKIVLWVMWDEGRKWARESAVSHCVPTSAHAASSQQRNGDLAHYICKDFLFLLTSQAREARPKFWNHSKFLRTDEIPGLWSEDWSTVSPELTKNCWLARKVNWVQLHFWKLKKLTQKSEETAFIWD